jgi:hypothetical protein
VDRGTPWASVDPRLAQNGHRLALLQGGFQRAQLRVDLAQRAQLGEHELVVALSEAMQAEDEPSEVAVGELARLAQEAGASSQATACREAGLCLGAGRVGLAAAAHRVWRSALGRRG